MQPKELPFIALGVTHGRYCYWINAVAISQTLMSTAISPVAVLIASRFAGFCHCISHA